YGFHDHALPRQVRSAYHALALDEQRRAFRPVLWDRQIGADDQTLEQVWFAGVHADVGGGYRDTALSDISLLWMVDRARRHGLEFDPDRLVPRVDFVDPSL